MRSWSLIIYIFFVQRLSLQLTTNTKVSNIYICSILALMLYILALETTLFCHFTAILSCLGDGYQASLGMCLHPCVISLIFIACVTAMNKHICTYP